ncbi:hypothetical protein TAMA11512_22100 [Selenomonas sp. TAMA-11512]|nr:hypothetical protein TAMA11512_22100 [Selenomonas sp. TAMA-11512]
MTILPSVALEDEAQKKLVVDCLSSVDDLCQSALSAKRASYYHDIFHGILSLIEQADWGNVPQEEYTRSSDLMAKILQMGMDALQEEREIKQVIFFLPYKVSMWDSLESIYQAAKADVEHCEAYVMPIPYCDRDPDGMPAAWHCESPKHVRCLDFQEYPLERLREIRPDAIFFHNPYDGVNYVTSVHPDYYAEKLKDVTDKLVYVPYYISGSSISDLLCRMPGVIHADYVIAESEEIARQMRAAHANDPAIAEKILPLGSPKFDTVLGKTPRDFKLPPAWKKVCAGRKVVLYNTSISDALNASFMIHDGRSLVTDKIREVFDYFREHREYALWWRPHPLMKETLRSMRPALVETYEALERTYRKEGWGVYDDTPDVDRAIVCSDVYYGDFSSMIWLYQATGKPILIENLNPYQSCTVGTTNFSVEEDRVSFVDAWTRRLLHWDWGMSQSVTDGRIPLEMLTNSYFPYAALVRQGNLAVILPMWNRSVLSYDYCSKEFKKIDEITNVYVYENAGLVTYVARCHETLYAYGMNSSEIFKYDFRSGQCTHLSDWFEELRESLNLRQVSASVENRLLMGFVRRGRYLYIACAKANLVLSVDTETDCHTFHSIGDSSWRFVDIADDGEYLWILGAEGQPVVRWQPETGTVDSYEYADKVPEGVGYTYLECSHHSIHVYPDSNLGLGREVLIDKETGEVSLSDFVSTFVRTRERFTQGRVCLKTGRDFSEMIWSRGKSQSQMRMYWKDVTCSSDDFASTGIMRGCFYERQPLSLQEFLLRAGISAEENSKEQTYGEIIYRHICNAGSARRAFERNC